MSNKDSDINKSVLKKLAEWKDSPLQFVTDCINAVPSTQQIELLQAIGKDKRVTIRSGHGCHVQGTGIHMYPYGFKHVEDVKVGEQLMGNDGTPRNVLSLIRGKEKIYRIQYHDKTYYDVNESHILALVCTGNKCGYRTGDKIEITVKEYLKMIKDRPSLKGRFAGYKVGVEYPEIPLIIPPYILGMWLGDGSHNQLEFTNIDRKLIGIWQLFGEANGLGMTTTCDKLHRLIGDTGGVVKNAFKHYNLLGNKHIPKEYLFNTKENRLLLLAGLLDTDGYADTRNSLQFQIIQKRKGIAEDILFLAQSCGMHATLSPKIKTWVHEGIKKSGTYYEVRISRNTEQIPTQLERKQSTNDYSKQRTNLHFGFNVIELEEEDNYYGFELDNNHLYLLDDFTVTHNTGKDASASWVAIWFLTTRPYAKVVVTAPTNRQLKDIFLAEISKWLRQSVVADEFIIRRDTIQHKEAPKEWWLRLISPSVRATKEEQGETLAGLHGDHLLIICDESSGIPDPTFIPLEGAITQPDNKVLLIGNMTKNFGYFYDSHFHSEFKKQWVKLHWDSRESTNVDPSMPKYFETKYGLDSNVYRIRVEGNPPLQDENTLIPLWAAEQCIGNDFDVAEDEPIYLGVDVARYGDDASIVMPRQGYRIDPWETFRKLNTIDLGGFVNQTYQELNADGIGIDSIGVGGGVADWLEKRNIQNLYQVNVTAASSDIAKYHRLRDELWCKVRDACLLGKYSFPDVVVNGETETLGKQLASELSVVRYSFNAHGGFLIESKKDLKARGIDSPNIADALCITEYFQNSSTRVFAKDKPDYYGLKEFRDTFTSNTSWMGL